MYDTVVHATPDGAERVTAKLIAALCREAIVAMHGGCAEEREPAGGLSSRALEARSRNRDRGVDFPEAIFMCRARFPLTGHAPPSSGSTSPAKQRIESMAKAANIKIKLLSTADTGFFYVTSKNSRTKTDKMSFRKYDPIAKKHVEFKETKIK